MTSKTNSLQVLEKYSVALRLYHQAIQKDLEDIQDENRFFLEKALKDTSESLRGTIRVIEDAINSIHWITLEAKQ